MMPCYQTVQVTHHIKTSTPSFLTLVRLVMIGSRQGMTRRIRIEATRTLCECPITGSRVQITGQRFS